MSERAFGVTAVLRVALSTVVSVVAVVLLPAPSVTAETGARPSVLAHQGTPDVHGENTVEGQLAAIRKGATCAETDLRISRDGYFVQMHDTTVDRTTDGTGAIHEMTIDEIRRLRTTIGHNRVPTLQDSLRALRPTRGCLVVEITGFYWSAAKVAEMREIIAARHMTRRTVGFSANTDYLELLRDRAPRMRTIWKAIGYPSVSRAIELGVDVVVPRKPHLTDYVVGRLHEVGLEVYSPVADRPKAWEHIIEVGCDGLLTERTRSFLDWYDDRGRLADPTG